MIDFRFPASTRRPETVVRRLAQQRGEWTPDTLRQLADFLATHDAHNQMVSDFCQWPDDLLIEFLELIWNHSHYDLQNLAEGILVRRGSAGLVRWLEKVAKRPQGSRWLVDALANVQDDDSTRLLLELLDHPEASIRRRAADGLASHRSSLDARGFIRFLAQPLVHGHAEPDPTALVRALHRIADSALEPEFGKDAARRAERVLINSVRHETRPAVRGDAIAALGEIGSRTAVHCLVDMLSRHERAFHREVVIALRKIHPDRALIALLGLLQSKDPIIREEAANALGAIGDPKAVKRVRDLLDDPNPDVRQEAVLALGKMGGHEILAAVERALSDPDPAVRSIACHVLAEQMGGEAQGKLIGALYDGSADVRSEAAYHLGNVGNDDAVAHLRACLRDRALDAFGDSVASIARKALYRLSTPRRSG